MDDEHPDNKVVDRLMNNARTKEWKPMKPNEKHREMASELAAITHDGWRPERIAFAIADAEARGREMGIREAADVVRKLPNFAYATRECEDIANRILALLKDGGE